MLQKLFKVIQLAYVAIFVIDWVVLALICDKIKCSAKAHVESDVLRTTLHDQGRPGKLRSLVKKCLYIH